MPEGDLYEWDATSTYVKNPPYFLDMPVEPPPVAPIVKARVLAVLGDSITTDHISPAGSIKPDSPAGRYLIEHGVSVADFNSYGSRRGNHEVMVRGTFANVRLRNRLAPGTEGGWTRHLPDGEPMTIFDASRALPGRGGAARSSWRARNTARARRATGRPRGRCFWASGPSSPRATSGSTGPTWSAWGSCRSSSSPARTPQTPRPDGRRGLLDRGTAGGDRRPLQRRPRADRRRPSAPAGRRSGSPCPSGSTLPRRSGTMNMAASSLTCSASCSTQDRDPAGRSERDPSRSLGKEPDIRAQCHLRTI